ncbi:MAG: hypothetical protein H0U46_04210 [Actinobacteria bacterium]|nr:hypothetical protein [Actinomycetota bacterium]
MRGPRLVLALCSTVLLVTAPAGGATKPVKATLVGDSVAASIGYTKTARAELQRGLAVRLDLAECRRLVQPSCAFKGSKPSTALAAVLRYGRSLGNVLIVSVGYNESALGYAEGIDRVMRAALAQRARAVVWVTLRETSQLYRRTNRAIKQAVKRWSQLTVADWNAYSRNEPWFASDGLHLTGTGSEELAAFIRQHVFKALHRTGGAN